MKRIGKKNAVNIYARFRPTKRSETESPDIQRINADMIRVDPERMPSSRGGTPIAMTPRSRRPTPRRGVHDSRGLYRFHRVFGPMVPTSEVYQNTTHPMVATLFKGYNCTILAYGISGSGKTYTMMGSETPGIIPRSIDEIFKVAAARETDGWTTTFSVSSVQIYMEKILDLLAGGSFNPDTEHSLRIRQRGSDIYVEGVKWVDVSTPEECIKIIRDGERHRVVASTGMNNVSSRSHMVFMFRLEQKNETLGKHLVSKFYLVDLAGSEAIRQTKAEGLVLQQACHVNKSLSALSNVIMALTTKKQHIPYRDSQLTRLLTHALGGNSKTAIILCCTSSDENLAETIQTLQFGQRALHMPNKPSVNAANNVDYEHAFNEARILLKKQKTLMKALEAENRLLTEQLESSKSELEAARRLSMEEQRASSCMLDERNQRFLEVPALDAAGGDWDDMFPGEPMNPMVNASRTPDFEDDYSDDDSIILPAVDDDDDDGHVSLTTRYFTPRSVAAMSTEIVKQVQTEKSVLEHRLQAQIRQCDELNDSLLQARDEAHTLRVRLVEAQGANIESASAGNVVTAEPTEESTSRLDQVEQRVGNEVETIDIVLMALGSIVIVGILVTLLVLKRADWVMWICLSGAAAGGLVLGWGLPSI